MKQIHTIHKQNEIEEARQSGVRSKSKSKYTSIDCLFLIKTKFKKKSESYL